MQLSVSSHKRTLNYTIPHSITPFFFHSFPSGYRSFLTALQTGRAIKFAVDHVFSSSQRTSEVKNRIAVVVTDGKSQDDVVNVTLLYWSVMFLFIPSWNSACSFSLSLDLISPVFVSLGGCQYGGASSGDYSIRSWSWQWDHQLRADIHS